MRKQSLKISFSKTSIRICHLSHICRINTKQLTDLIIPLQIKNIKQLGPGSIGIICSVLLTLCQLKHQPAVNSTMTDFVAFCCLLCTFFIFQKPCNFRSREIWRKIHSCFLADHLSRTGSLHTGTYIYCTGTLPYNCISIRLTCNTVPCKGSFTLVADAKTNHTFFFNTLKQFPYNLKYIAVNLLRIMGNPSLLIDDLLMRTVCAAHNTASLIKEKSLGTLGTLINTYDIFCHFCYPLFSKIQRQACLTRYPCCPRTLRCMHSLWIPWICISAVCQSRLSLFIIYL